MRFRMAARQVTRSLIVLIAGSAFGLSTPRATEHDPERTSRDSRPLQQPANRQSPAAQRARVDSVYAQTRGTSRTYPGSEAAVIYGADDRKEYYQIADQKLAQAAGAVCVITHLSELTDNGDGTYLLAATPWTADICADEQFYGQLTVGFCTGFLVGDDLVATAGHCVDLFNCGSTAFVFGWWKSDSAAAAPMMVPAEAVYFCSGIVDQVDEGDYDHSIVQLDRAVIGRTPVPIRRDGVVADGEPLSVIGHGIHLPLKEAGGAVVKNANGSIPWFQANLDAFGGNSGSPVFNLNTYTVEGILVRGAPDFVLDDSCYRSYMIPDTGNPGSGLEFEEVSKSTGFAASVPPLIFRAGTIDVVQSAYGCADTAWFDLRDIDLAGTGPQSVQLTTSSGDVESALLVETPSVAGMFLGHIPVSEGIPTGGNGALEVANGEIITATYQDADDGTGSPATVSDTAEVDCIVPVISGVHVQDIVGTQVWIAFDTDEPATGTVRFGVDCGTWSQSTAGLAGNTAHLILLSGLMPQTTYYFSVEAVDGAANMTADDNGGSCFSFATLEQPDYLTEQFDAGDGDLDHQTITFTPDSTGDYYGVCNEATAVFPTDPAGGTTLALTDDDFQEVLITGGEAVLLYGESYGSCFVGSNGYVTFGAGDADYSESLADHFGPWPRVSLLFDELDPSSGGTISHKQLADRLVITYEDVPELNTGDANSFQAEMYFDGRITITHLLVDAADGVVGLSSGHGLPAGFVESDLSDYGPCACPDGDADDVCDADDNCPDTGNTDQIDSDGDGWGNVCDACPAYVTPGDVAILTGDVNVDSVHTSSDIIYLVNYVFRGGPLPLPVEVAGDVNCNGVIASADIIYTVNFVFKGGPEPCDVCAVSPP